MAAIDCDEDSNKQLCGSMGVQGFPTLKIVRPGKKAGRPVIEDYNGQRTANGIVEAVVSKINNHVTRVADKDLDSFLAGDKPKAILFTEKGTTSALLRSIAIEYLDVISVAQIRNKEKDAVAKFGIGKFPTLVLVPADGADPVVYDGELNKKDMVDFLRQAGEPNPDPAPAGGKKQSKAGKKPAKEKKPEKTPPVYRQEEEAKPEEAAKEEKPQDTTEEPAGGASNETPPRRADSDVVAIKTVVDDEDLASQCLQPKSHTCILAFVPVDSSENGDKAVASLSQLNTKYINGHRQMFPFLAVPSSVKAGAALQKSLDIKQDVEVVAINTRRMWWRRYEGDFGVESIESWIDAIRMGEGSKMKLPKDVVAAAAAEPEAEAEAKPEAEKEEAAAEDGASEDTPKSEEDEEDAHDEL